MLVRFGRFREFGRLTEEVLDQRRVRQTPVGVYGRGEEFKIAVDPLGVDPGSTEVEITRVVNVAQAVEAATATA